MRAAGFDTDNHNNDTAGNMDWYYLLVIKMEV